MLLSLILLKQVAPHGGLSPEGPFEFHLNGDSPFFKILDFTRLIGEFELLDPTTNELIEDTTDVSFINNLGHSWIQQIEVYLNDKQVVDLSTPSYAYKAFIENFLSFSKDKKKYDLRNQLYLDDNDADFDKDTIATSDTLKKRRALLQGTHKNKGYFTIPLNIDVFQTPVFLCPGVNLKVKIIKNKDNFFLMSDGLKAKFKIKDLSLRFRLVETAKKFSDDISKVNLGNANAYYPYYMTKIRTNLITQGIQSYTWPAAVRGKLPKQLICAFVDHSAYSGDFKKNPFAFENFDINGLCLRINGVSHPSKPYQVDFGDGKYSMLYDDLIRNIGIGHQNESAGISLETYVKHKLLWVFDLTPDNCNRRELHVDHHGDIDVEVSFKTATTKTITLLLYTATFGGLVVGKDMQVSLMSTDN